MKLRYVETVDFRKSEATNYQALSIKLQKQNVKLSKENVVLFINKNGNQLLFVYAHEGAQKESRGAVRDVLVLRSVRLRIQSGRWDPKMLSHYADAHGIRLEGIKKFEQYYGYLTENPATSSPTKKAA